MTANWTAALSSEDDDDDESFIMSDGCEYRERTAFEQQVDWKRISTRCQQK